MLEDDLKLYKQQNELMAKYNYIYYILPYISSLPYNWNFVPFETSFKVFSSVIFSLFKVVQLLSLSNFRIMKIF